jgi:dUTPase
MSLDYETPIFRFAVRDDLNDMADKFLPKRAEPGSVGYDVRCAQKDRKPIRLRAGQYAKIELGFRVIPASGYWLDLRPRSSTFAKKYLHYLIGTLDFSWRGWCEYACQYIPDLNNLGKDLTLEFGDAIGQIVPVKMQSMEPQLISNVDFDEFCKTETNLRGTKGWGSTGN